MKIPVNSQIHLELINDEHAPPIFEMVNQHRTYLREWLSFVDRMQTVDFAQHFVKGTMQRNQDGMEHAFVIYADGVMVGRIGIYKIDHQNKIGEIGYWVVEDYQGKGIVTASCQAIVKFGFEELGLNRLEIKCGTGNLKSQGIPKRLGFKMEGVLSEAEFLHGHYIDLNLYSLIKSDFDSELIF